MWLIINKLILLLRLIHTRLNTIIPGVGRVKFLLGGENNDGTKGQTQI